MTNAQLIAAIRRMVHGAKLTPTEASEIVALVVQNTIHRRNFGDKYTDCGRLKGSPY